MVVKVRGSNLRSDKYLQLYARFILFCRCCYVFTKEIICHLMLSIVLGILFHLEFLITAKFTTNYKGMKTETKHL